MKWQPIETAPKDGNGILAYSATGHWIVFWMSGGWYDATHLLRLKAQPTHWMPLPEPPEGE